MFIALWSLNVNASEKSKILKPNAPMKKLLIQNQNEKKIEFNVNEMDTILSIKEKIEMLENVPVLYQKLLLYPYKKFGFDMILENNKSLNEYPIFEDKQNFIRFELSKDLPEVDALTLDEAVEIHSEHIPLAYEVKIAIVQDNATTVETLVDNINIGENNNNQVTLALFFAVISDSINVVNMLCKKYPWAAYDHYRDGNAGLDWGFERHAKRFEYAKCHANALGDFPLIAAILLQKLQMVETMMACVDKEIDYETRCMYMSIKIPGKDGSIYKPNAWIMAVAMNQVEIFKLWQKYPHVKRDESTPDEIIDMSMSTQSVLNCAVQFKSKECFEYLIANFLPNKIDYNARTIFETSKWDLDLLIKLTKHLGTDMLERDSKLCAMTLYRMCAFLKDESMIHAMFFLLSKVEIRENINTPFQNMTPLIVVSYYEYIDEDLAIQMSQMLLENGQDPNIQRNGKTALEIAKWRNRNKLAQSLEDSIFATQFPLKKKEVDELKLEIHLKDKEITDLKDEQNKQLCTICLDRKKTHVCIPCMHLCVCEICVIQPAVVSQCPICRQHGTYHRIFE